MTFPELVKRIKNYESHDFVAKIHGITQLEAVLIAERLLNDLEIQGRQIEMMLDEVREEIKLNEGK